MSVYPITGDLVMMASTGLSSIKLLGSCLSSGYRAKYRLGGLRSKCLFLSFLEAGKSKNRAQAEPVSGEALFLVC